MNNMPYGLVLTKNNFFCDEIKKNISSFMKLKECVSFKEFLNEVIKFSPYFAIIDCDSVEISNEVLLIFEGNSRFKLSNILLVSKEKRLVPSGFKQCSYDELKDEINNLNSLLLKKTLVAFNRQGESGSYSLKISNILSNLGFASKHIGTIYLKRAIEEMVKCENSICSLNKTLYPKLAKQYNTLPNNVERNIRNSIRQSFKLSGKEKFEKILKTKLTNEHFPPNRSFISLVCDLVLAAKNEDEMA